LIQVKRIFSIKAQSITIIDKGRWLRDQLRSRLFGNGGRHAANSGIPRGAIIFDPEAIKIVAQALDDAWDQIEKSGSGFARPAYANATREEIAKHMIEVAGRGERDQHILAEDAVRFLAENYKF
jgi:hypothetical protein